MFDSFARSFDTVLEGWGPGGELFFTVEAADETDAHDGP
jgi:hypothetical protein